MALTTAFVSLTEYAVGGARPDDRGAASGVVETATHSLLEAFAGVPRATAAAVSAVAALTWVASWTWLSRRPE